MAVHLRRGDSVRHDQIDHRHLQPPVVSCPYALIKVQPEFSIAHVGDHGSRLRLSHLRDNCWSHRCPGALGEQTLVPKYMDVAFPAQLYGQTIYHCFPHYGDFTLIRGGFLWQKFTNCRALTAPDAQNEEESMCKRTAMTTLLASALAAGCASHSGVAPLGGGKYVVSKQAATGFPGLGTLKADLLRDADQFCTGRKQQLAVDETSETSPPYLLGNYPRAEVMFHCN